MNQTGKVHKFLVTIRFNNSVNYSVIDALLQSKVVTVKSKTLVGLD